MKQRKKHLSFNTDVFSFKLYLSALDRLKVLAIICAVTVIIPNMLFGVFRIVESRDALNGADVNVDGIPVYGSGNIYDVDYYKYVRGSVDPETFIPLCLALLILAPIAVQIVFGFLNKRGESDFYHSIPHKRICVYNSFTAAVITLSLGIILLSALLNTVLALFAPHFRLTALTVWQTVFTYACVTVLFIGYALLASMLTGNAGMAAFMTLALAVCVPFISTIAYEYLMIINPFLPESRSIFSLLWLEYRLPYNLLLGMTNSAAFETVVPQLISLVSGIILIALSAILYCKRPSFTAGKLCWSERARNLFCIAVGVPFAMMLVWSVATDSGDAFETAILAMVCVLVFFLCQLITSKSPKKAARSMALALVPVAISAAIIGSVELTSVAVNATAPDAESIAGIKLDDLHNYENHGFYVNVRELEVDAEGNPELMEIIADVIENSAHRKAPKHPERDFDGGDIGRWQYDVGIRLKNGSMIYRDLYFSRSQLKKLTESVLASKDFLDAVTYMPTKEETRQLKLGGLTFNTYDDAYAIFIEEYQALTDAERLIVCRAPESATKGTVATVRCYDGYTKSIMIYHDLMPRTAAVCYATQTSATSAETVKSLSEVIEWIEKWERKVYLETELISLASAPRICEGYQRFSRGSLDVENIEEIAKVAIDACDTVITEAAEDEDIFRLIMSFTDAPPTQNPKPITVSVYIKLDAESYEALLNLIK